MENLKELIDVTNALIFALKIDGRKDKANTELIKEAERIIKLCNMPVVSNSEAAVCDHEWARTADDFDLTVYCKKCGKSS